MVSKILITGAAGYIGGSVLSDLLASKNDTIRKAQYSAAVRSEEQAKALSKLGINVLQLDLTDEKAAVEGLLSNDINIVVHIASSINPALALPLITALGKQKEVSGQETYFIHTSGLSAFYERTGWSAGAFEDTSPVFEQEKKLANSFVIRKTDVSVVEHARAQGVTSFIVIPPIVYGKGTGEWNQLSINIPAYIKASISQRTVHKFPEYTRLSGVHISDLTTLYERIIEKILLQEPISSGTEGYYFALAHDLIWWEVIDHLAAALKTRGLVDDTDVKIWPDDEAAAQALGVPTPFVQVLWNSGGDIIAKRVHEIGWKPRWDKERFLREIGGEIDAVQELGKAKSSLIDSLFKALGASTPTQ